MVLVCTDCQHVFEPDVMAELPAMGCERCGGWTWIAELTSPSGPFPAVPTQRPAQQMSVSMGEKR